MSRPKQLLKKIQKTQKVRFYEMEKLLEVYGFEIDKSSGGAHWTVLNTQLVDEEGHPLQFPFWRPHGRKENFLSPRTKKKYLGYIEKVKTD